MSDDDQTEIADEFDPETGTYRGTGAATAHAANMAMRLMASGLSPHEAVEAMKKRSEGGHESTN